MEISNDNSDDAAYATANESVSSGDFDVNTGVEDTPLDAGNKDQKKKIDKLIEVQSIKHVWFGRTFTASFVLDDSTLLPSESEKDYPLSFRLEGSTIDPKIKFFLSDGELSSLMESGFPATLEFAARDISRFRFDSTVNSGGKWTNYMIEFVAHKGLTVGLKKILGKKVELIQKHMLAISSSSSVVKFRFRVWTEDFSVEDITEDFQILTGDGLTWMPYRSIKSLSFMTTYGQLMPRFRVEQRYPSKVIFNIPAADYFASTREAAVRFVYGSYLEHCVSLININRLSDFKHKITIFKVDSSESLLGAVKFGKLKETFTPSPLLGAQPVLSSFTPCDVKVFVGGREKPFRYKGIVVPDVVKLPTDVDIVLLLVATNDASKDAGFIDSVSGTEEEYSCNLVFNCHEANVKNQVNAVNKICSNDFQQWHGVLLNQEYESLPHVDIMDGINADVIATAYESANSFQEWNDKQLAVFQLPRNLPGNGFAFVEGIFGCGKTLVESVLAKLLHDVGIHVLFVAPTNTAVQAISETLLKAFPTLNVVRVITDAAHDIPVSASDAGSKVEHMDRREAMFNLLHNVVSARTARYDVLPEHDLANHVYSLAMDLKDGKQSLLFSYEADDSVTQHDAVHYYTTYKETKFRPLIEQANTEEDKKKLKRASRIFRKAVAALEADVVRTTRVLLCTPQVAATDLVRHNFATSDCTGLVLIRDEDGQMTESDGWIPVTLLTASRNLKGVICFGDRKQLPPTATAMSTDYNEFAAQVNRSLLDRHMRCHKPAVWLNTQYRMHPVLAEFPGDHTYGGQLLSGSSCSELTMDPIFAERAYKYFTCRLPQKTQFEQDSSRLLGINADDGFVEVQPVTLSRINHYNVEVIAELLRAVFKEAPYPKASITIITPYTGQRSVYYKVIRDLQCRTKLPLTDLPRVATVDSMQGHESDIVILDWVNTSFENLGLLRDDRRINVALTRARTSMLVIFTKNCLSVEDTRTKTKWKKSKKSKKPQKLPEVVLHWLYLLKEDLLVDATTKPTKNMFRLKDVEESTEDGKNWSEGIKIGSGDSYGDECMKQATSEVVEEQLPVNF